MRVLTLIAGALALALLLPTPVAAQTAPKCEFTVESAKADLTASKFAFVLFDGDLKDKVVKALAASITLQTGKPAPDFSPVTRVLIVEIQGDLFFGIETLDGCLSAPLPLATFFPTKNRSGRDALGTHS
ncbi:MAG: hypothetical protein ACR2K1_10040 [Saprospiraceae bacterium]